MVSVSQGIDNSIRINNNQTGPLSPNKAKNTSTSDNTTTMGAPDGSSNINTSDLTSPALGIGAGLLPSTGEILSPNEKTGEETHGRNSETHPREVEGAPKKGT